MKKFTAKWADANASNLIKHMGIYRNKDKLLIIKYLKNETLKSHY